MSVNRSTDGRYVLATGDEAERRLELVDAVHGRDTASLLERAGVGPGLRVADFGCGIGVVSCAIAELVEPAGEVIGIDISPEQIAVAERRSRDRRLPNLRFITGSLEEPGLEPGSCDIVYARFLLMHLQNPRDAIRRMASLLTPTGRLVIEDGDFSAPYCIPLASAFDRCFELYRGAVSAMGGNPRIGPDLPMMVMDEGFSWCAVSVVQPTLREGEAKRLPEWTMLEARETLVHAGLAIDSEIDAIAVEMERLALDSTTKFGMAEMTQVCATRR